MAQWLFGRMKEAARVQKFKRLKDFGEWARVDLTRLPAMP
jgi:hypothetical protein